MSRDEDGQVDDVADNGHGVDVDKDGLVEMLREVTLEGGDEGDRDKRKNSWYSNNVDWSYCLFIFNRCSFINHIKL